MNRTTIASLLLLWTSTTAAQGPNVDPPERTVLEDAEALPEIQLTEDQHQLALAVAKVCANEASLYRPTLEDCALIWQVTRSHGETAQERLSWLSRHSRCVLGEKAPEERRQARRPPQGSNCWWSWHLDEEGNEPPNFDAGAAWSNLQGTWLRMLHACRRLVRGDRPPRGWPCPHDPDTWGGRRIDMERALAHGQHQIHCEGTANEGFRFAGHPPPRRRTVR